MSAWPTATAIVVGRGGNATQITGLAGSSVNLPCDISLPNNHERVTLILWYREDLGVPIFSLEVGTDGSIASGVVWSDQEWLGDRAQFRPEAFPALLRIHDISGSDAGKYRCRVDFAEAPSRNSWINLTVIVPPDPVVIFDESGSARTSFVGPYTEGQQVTLICDAFGGRPPPRLTWSRDGRIVDNTFSVMPNGTVRNEIVFRKVDRSFLHDQLTCAASNTNLTRPVTVSVNVDMNFAPVTVRIESGRDPEARLVAGRAAEVVCRTVGSRPPAIITWYLKGRRIEGGSEETTPDGNTTVSVLAFTPEMEDIGKKLQCRAENRVMADAEPIVDEIRLRIDYAPRVELILGASISPDSVYEGGDVYFDCRIQSRPPPKKIIWQFDGLTVGHNPTAGIIQTNQSLVLQSINRTRSGGYTCQAVNAVGKGRSQEMHLNVKYVPVCSSVEPVVYGVGKGEMVDVFCDVVSNPQSYNFEWSFNNSADYIRVPPSRVVVVNGTRSKLTYTPLNNKDYGTLMCSATNEVGRQRNPCIFHIILAVAPDPVSNCTIINKSSETFHLQCIPGFDGGMEQMFHVTVTDRATGVTHFNKTTRELDLFIENLSEGTSYLTTVMPANKKGVGKSVHVIVDTLRHPAVELTQVEEAHRSQDSDHPESPGDLNVFGHAAEEWAVPAGIVAGGAFCVTFLVIASLVIRRTRRRRNVAGRTVRSNSSYGKSELSPAASMHDADSGNGGGGGGGGANNPFTTASSSNGAPTAATMAATLSGTMRKGILKHSSAACNGATEWDAELDRMVVAAGDSGELILPPPPPPQITLTDRSHCEFYQLPIPAPHHLHGGSSNGEPGNNGSLDGPGEDCDRGARSGSRKGGVPDCSSTLPHRRVTRDGLSAFCDISATGTTPRQAGAAASGARHNQFCANVGVGEGSTEPLLQPIETAAAAEVHMRTSGGVGQRSNSGGKSNSGGGSKRKKVMQMVKGEEKKRLTPLFKRKRESIV